jgi:hypothetical protein
VGESCSPLLATGGLKPWRSISQVPLWTSLKVSSARRNSSTVAKRRSHSRFSPRVRMNRSAQPLP